VRAPIAVRNVTPHLTARERLLVARVRAQLAQRLRLREAEVLGQRVGLDVQAPDDAADAHPHLALLGRATALLQAGTELTGPDAALYERTKAAAREALGAERLAELMEAGAGAERAAPASGR
jgi:hypothetical protein